MPETDKNKRILITGVHTTPALAVLNELQARGYSNFVWVGRKYLLLGSKEESLEYKILKEKNIDFVNLITGKIQRTFDLTFFYWIIRIPIGFIQAFFILLKYKPELVVTFGSYVGVPISFWAWVFRIKIIVHEQTLIGGLANAFITKFATVACLSWKRNDKKYKKKFVYTGNPIQKNVFEVTTNDFVFADTTRPTVFFVAGKTGSHKLNLVIMNSIKRLVRDFNVIHQTGSNPIADDLTECRLIAKEINTEGVKYIPTMGYIGGEGFQKASIVVSRGGANTIYELAALGKVSIIIPIPFTQKDEQTKNAQLLESTGIAKLLHQSVLTPDTLISTIIEVNNNFSRMQSCAPAAKALVTLDADKKIADIVETFLISKKKQQTKVQKVDQEKSAQNNTISKKYHANLEALNKFIELRLSKMKKKNESASTQVEIKEVGDKKDAE